MSEPDDRSTAAAPPTQPVDALVDAVLRTNEQTLRAAYADARAVLRSAECVFEEAMAHVRAAERTGLATTRQMLARILRPLDPPRAAESAPTEPPLPASTPDAES